jgi:hypothetical protein
MYRDSAHSERDRREWYGVSFVQLERAEQLRFNRHYAFIYCYDHRSKRGIQLNGELSGSRLYERYISYLCGDGERGTNDNERERIAEPALCRDRNHSERDRRERYGFSFLQLERAEQL